MNVLGISAFFHDAAAALVRDGQTVAAAEEERFNRERHTGRFPRQAIDYCLHEAGLTVHDLDVIAFFLNANSAPAYALGQMIRNTVLWARAHSATLGHALLFTKANPVSLWRLSRPFGHAGLGVIRWSSIVRRQLDLGHRKPLLIGVPHHLSHIAGSYLISGFQDAAIIVADGRGEWATTTLASGDREDVKVIKTISLPDSLGFLYGAVTSFLGYHINSDEGKVMGLSSYGRPLYGEAFRRFLTCDNSGAFRLNTSCIDFPLAWSARYFPPRMISALGPPRAPQAELEPRHADIARSLQDRVEDVLLALCRYLERQISTQRLCVSGGVAMNSAAVGRLHRESAFREIYVPPAPGDSGAALGAAVWVAAQMDDHPLRPCRTPYLGPAYGAKESRTALEDRGLRFTRRPDIVDVAARLLSQGKILAWFQGRMEFGPRALGNRSILADPRDPQIRDRVNTLKGRELWRPLAPSVLAHRMEDWFVEPGESPYMSFVKTARRNGFDQIPACVHVDGTSRVQTVRPEDNLLFWRLLARFDELTGVPCLLNTSFNQIGEPIVCHPRDAVRSFINMKLDYLILGDLVAARSESLPQIT